MKARIVVGSLIVVALVLAVKYQLITFNVATDHLWVALEWLADKTGECVLVYLITSYVVGKHSGSTPPTS